MKWGLKRYVRVWVKGMRPLTLMLLSTDGDYVKGLEVDEQGDEVQPKGVSLPDHGERLHYVHKSRVKAVQRMTLNPIYAALVYSGERQRGVPSDLLPSFVESEMEVTK